eukprot:m.181672 g.181672  ORF g.181672 m.181672 type:complete len:78 (-) comp13585_c0_seq28:4386-4619(-)
MDVTDVTGCADACVKGHYSSANFDEAFKMCMCSVSPSGYSTIYCGPPAFAIFRPWGIPYLPYGKQTRFDVLSFVNIQ